MAEFIALLDEHVVAAGLPTGTAGQSSIREVARKYFDERGGAAASAALPTLARVTGVKLAPCRFEIWPIPHFAISPGG